VSPSIQSIEPGYASLSVYRIFTYWPCALQWRTALLKRRKYAAVLVFQFRELRMIAFSAVFSALRQNATPAYHCHCLHRGIGCRGRNPGRNGPVVRLKTRLSCLIDRPVLCGSVCGVHCGLCRCSAPQCTVLLQFVYVKCRCRCSYFAVQTHEYAGIFALTVVL